MNRQKIMQLFRDWGFVRTEEEVESFALTHPTVYMELAEIEEGTKEYEEFLSWYWNNRRQNNGMQNYGSL